MITITHYVQTFNQAFKTLATETPWQIVEKVEKIIREKINSSGRDYTISGEIAIHKSARVDPHAILKGPVVVGANCFIGAHAYLRGGVFLDESVSIGPGCEVKSSFIFSHSSLGHFNFVGDSIIGSDVNMEAGSVVANHYNERKEKAISVLVEGKRIPIGLEKFGALIGDRCKIGANAVLSPGTILQPDTIVRRLELIDQSC